MRVLSPALAAHIGEEVTTLATCWMVRRRDGVTMGFTTHDEALVIDGAAYLPTNAFMPTAIASSHGLSVDELEIAGVLSSAAIREDDLRAGRYDFAEVEFFMVNWADPAGGRLRLKTGWIGEVTIKNGVFIAEIRGLTQALQQTFGAVYSPECRAALGDAACRVDLSAVTVSANVAGVMSRRVFTASSLGKPDGWLAYGSLRWLSGVNAGQMIEIKGQVGTTIELFEAAAGDIAAGDLFTAVAGCDKRFTTCRAKFNNVLNFRGEPHVPGTDAVLDYPGIR